MNIPYAEFHPPKNNPGFLIDIYVLESILKTVGFEPTHSIAIVYSGKDATDFRRGGVGVLDVENRWI